MKLYFFKTKKEAEEYGFVFPKAKFKEFSTIVVAHKKKIVTCVIGASGRRKLNFFCRDKPEDVVFYINQAINELSRVYPELRKISEELLDFAPQIKVKKARK